MNKVQRKCMEGYLTMVLRKLERCEERRDIAEDSGDTDAVERLTVCIETLVAELKGADSILTMLGYVRKHHDDDDKGFYTIEKV